MDSAGTAVRPLIADDRRCPDAVGRSARLELVFGSRGGRTVLLQGYAEPPLRVGRPFAEGTGVHVILAASAPGIFGGDRFEQRIVLEAGARVRLTSQSALQVHPSLDAGVAGLRSTYEIGDDAELQCLWAPVIPFAGSRFDQQTTVLVAPSGRLVWSDAMMAGRAGRGERWQFASLCQHLRVYRGDRLEYLERYRIRPMASPVAAPWVAGACCYFATGLAIGWPTSPARAEALHVALAATLRESSGAAAVDALGPATWIARIAAAAGPAFHAARDAVSQAMANVEG